LSSDVDFEKEKGLIPASPVCHTGQDTCY